MNFATLIKAELEMSLMGELTFLLEHQINQSTNRTFISQEKYNKELSKMFGLDKGQAFGTRMSMPRVLKLMHLEKTWM